MTKAALIEHYRAYIGTINLRGEKLIGDDLEHFIHDEVVHNDRNMTRDEYAKLCSIAFDVMPDVRFNISLVVADEQESTVACRITFDKVHPRKELFGLKAGKAEVSFSENVFYKFEHSKIRQVWSVVDLKAFEAT